MKLLIKNGFAVLHDKTIKADILIENGRISRISPSIEADSITKTIDAASHHVMAGFVDMHTHLREPGFEHKEDIASGTLSALAGGYTAVACMPNTSPAIDSAELVKFVSERAKNASNAKVYVIGAVTKGQKGMELADIEGMKKAGIVAVSDDGRPIESAQMMRKALESSAAHNVLLISHCEDLSLAGDGAVNEGENAKKAGLKGIPASSEEVMVARDIILAEHLDVRIHIAHISTRGSVRMIREAKKRGVKVTCETCPQYFSATDDEILSLNTCAKMNPPLRTKNDVDAIIEGILDGTIDAIATDHAPHHEKEKKVEFSLAANGTVGLETAFGAAYTHLVKAGHITLERLSFLMSESPARLLGVDCGELKEGAAADITIVELGKAHKIDAKTFLSKARNSLFDGKKLFGKIAATIVDGEVKFEK